MRRRREPRSEIVLRSLWIIYDDGYVFGSLTSWTCHYLAASPADIHTCQLRVFTYDSFRLVFVVSRDRLKRKRWADVTRLGVLTFSSIVIVTSCQTLVRRRCSYYMLSTGYWLLCLCVSITVSTFLLFLCCTHKVWPKIIGHIASFAAQNIVSCFLR